MAFNYNHTPYYQKSIDEIDYLVDFISFFKISESAYAHIEKGCEEERYQKYLTLIAPEWESESSTNKQSYVNALIQAEKYLLGINANLEVRHLKKAHEILTRRTNFDGEGGVFRTVSESSTPNLSRSYKAPAPKEIEKLVKKLVRFINTTHQHHYAVKPWIVYYYIDLIRPFEKMNFGFSTLMLGVLLKKSLPNVPWFIEKFLFENWEQHLQTVGSGLFTDDFNSRYKQNISGFIQHSLELVLANLRWVKEITATIYLDEKQNTTNNPIKRNALNYVLELGFKNNHASIFELNERQRKLVEQVALNREVNTKLMVQTFRCDRKTIQRDFAEILKFDLVKQEGKTKTVKYSINFNSSGRKKAPTEMVEAEELILEE